MSDVPSAILIEKSDVFRYFKGARIEDIPLYGIPSILPLLTGGK
jgi:hypothetical protein